MSTQFKSEKVTANLNYKDLFKKFTNLNNLKDYLPQEVQEFESSTDNCSFKIEQLPKMSLQITEKHAYEKIKFESNESQIPFHMYCYIEKNDDNSSNIAWDICLKMASKGLLAKPTHGNIIRFAPPLIINKNQLDNCITIIISSLKEFE